MSALSDLQGAEAGIAAADTAIAASVASAITLIQQLQAAAGGAVAAADVEAVVTKLQADQSALSSAAATLNAAVQPAAPSAAAAKS